VPWSEFPIVPSDPHSPHQARAQAERLAKAKAEGDGKGAEPESPGTNKKMVPLEKLMLPARVRPSFFLFFITL